MYEPHHHPILPISHFIKRVIIHILIAVLVTIFWLILGIWGYRHFEQMTLVEAYENAAMILSGMGPIKDLTTDAGKIFAGTYAIFSGVLFLIVVGILLVPLLHRFFHKFLIRG